MYHGLLFGGSFLLYLQKPLKKSLAWKKFLLQPYAIRAKCVLQNLVMVESHAFHSFMDISSFYEIGRYLRIHPGEERRD